LAVNLNNCQARPPLRLNDEKMCKALLPLKLLADADMEVFGSKLIFCIFCPTLFKKRHWAKERVVRKISSPGLVAGMPYLCWAKESVAAVTVSESAVRYREVPGDRGGPTGSLELRVRIGSRRGPSQMDFGWKTQGP